MKFDIKNLEMKNKEIFKVNYINLSAEEIKNIFNKRRIKK